MSERKNFGAQPLLFPQPVLIIGTYDENGKANAMNAAWGGVHRVGRAVLAIACDDEHGLRIDLGLCAKILSHVEIPPK